MCSPRAFPVVAIALGLNGLACFASAAGPSDGERPPLRWTPQASGTTARLRGVSSAGDRVAWASGTGDTVVRTTDGGTTWVRRPLPGAGTLDVRDVEALGADAAVALSVGPGELSRIYTTADGGASWVLRFTNPDPDGFLDALAFWDRRHGLALGDPVRGRFVVLSTADGGASWSRVAPEGMPAALPGEGAFAASGTCLAARDDRLAWFGTGAGRVFRSDDRGVTWTAHPTPLVAGNGTSGVFSLAFRDATHGVVVGGDYREPARATRVAALSADRGQTWQPPAGSGPAGYRSAVVVLPGADTPALLAVGPTGCSFSRDGGSTWSELGRPGFHAAAAAGPRSGWAVGENGAVARFELVPSAGAPGAGR